MRGSVPVRARAAVLRDCGAMPLALAMLLALQGANAAGEEPPADAPWPAHSPAILPRPDDVAGLAAGFGLPAGFTATLFAAEPDVARYVSADRV